MTRLPGISLRVKLAASYAAFVLVVGVALSLIGTLVLRFVPEGDGYSYAGDLSPGRAALVEVFVRYSAWALIALAVIGIGGGWVLAGWMLRPVAQIGAVVAQTRDGAFRGRIRLAGRRDELTDLSDAFDGMLDRVERSVEAERRLAANASHELRTPLAVMRTLLEVARADPDGRDVEVLLERLSTTNDRSIALMEGTLALARVDRDALDRDVVDLATVVADAIDDVRADADARGIRISASLPAAPVWAHPALVAQLVGNLVRNAVVHNVDGGAATIEVVSLGGWTRLTVADSGPALDPQLVERLSEPFLRGAGRVRTSSSGAGLGLAIARAVAEAHGGTLLLVGPPDGGLRATAMLPSV